MATKKKTKAPAKVKPKTKGLIERHGECGCGSVMFIVVGPMSPVTWCHCSKCQRFHGGPGPYTTAPRGARRVARRDGLAWWNASPTVQRGFCKQCGSSLFFSDSNDAKIAICAGALKSPTGLRSNGHIFVASKPDWYEVKDGLPQHDTV